MTRVKAIDFWKQFPDFKHTPTRHWLAEFLRLALLRGWHSGQEGWTGHLRLCHAHHRATRGKNASAYLSNGSSPIKTGAETLAAIDFWVRFPDFVLYDNKPWKHEFDRLAELRNWTSGGEVYNLQLQDCWDSINQFPYVLNPDFLPVSPSRANDHDSQVVRLAKWQLLCQLLYLDPPESITKCKVVSHVPLYRSTMRNQQEQVLRKVQVNLYDLHDAWINKTHPPTFKTLKQLKQYSLDNNIVFPKQEAKKWAYYKMFLETFTYKGTESS